MLGSGNLIGSFPKPAINAAPGLHDTVDVRLSRLDNSWPTVSAGAIVDLLTTSYNEGDTITFTVRVVGIDIGQTINWEIVTVGATILTSTDFTVASGSFTVDNTYQKAITTTINSDGYTEGTETFQVRVKYAGNTLVNSGNIVISDTSTGTAEPAGLYTFSTFTFTNAGATGGTGPTRTNCLANYNTTTNPWLNDTAYFNIGAFQGFQLWTVPATGTYEFVVRGAAGGNDGVSSLGGLAAIITTNLTLSQGNKLIIIVGQLGGNGVGGSCGGNAGGGGGTFVLTQAGVCLIAAGGGGGAGKNDASFTEAGNKDAINSTSGRKGQGALMGGAGGTNGNGGGAPASSSCVPVGNAGAGILTNGYVSSGSGSKTYSEGFVGGGSLSGGFGGGGGAGVNYCGGGGGGYSGGGGGGLAACSCGYMVGGGAGGSYSSNSTYTFVNAPDWAHGSVKVTKL